MHLVAFVGCLGFALPAAADDAKTPFNGKDLSGWKMKDPKKSNWQVGKASLTPDHPDTIQLSSGDELVNAKGGGTDIYTEEKFGDSRIEVEVMVPKGSNSGIYVHGEYEVQVLDSFGRKKLTQGDMGALYSAAVPKVNASKSAGEWQKYVIEFRAPKFDAGGRKTANAKFVKVILNDQVIHENVEMKGPTPSGVSGKEEPTGPLMFQGDHGPVAYRNIKITPLK
jgi:hypothetical protein